MAFDVRNPDFLTSERHMHRLAYALEQRLFIYCKVSYYNLLNATLASMCIYAGWFEHALVEDWFSRNEAKISTNKKILAHSHQRDVHKIILRSIFSLKAAGNVGQPSR